MAEVCLCVTLPRDQLVGETISPAILVTLAISSRDSQKPDLYQARLRIVAVDGASGNVAGFDSVVAGPDAASLTAAFAGRLWFLFPDLAFKPGTEGHSYQLCVELWKSNHNATTNIWRAPRLVGEVRTNHIAVVRPGQQHSRITDAKTYEWDVEMAASIVSIQKTEPSLSVDDCAARQPEPKAIMHADLDKGPWAAPSYCSTTYKSRTVSPESR